MSIKAWRRRHACREPNIGNRREKPKQYRTQITEGLMSQITVTWSKMEATMMISNKQVGRCKEWFPLRAQWGSNTTVPTGDLAWISGSSRYGDNWWESRFPGACRCEKKEGLPGNCGYIGLYNQKDKAVLGWAEESSEWSWMMGKGQELNLRPVEVEMPVKKRW